MFSDGSCVVEGQVTRGDDFVHRRSIEYRPGERLVLHDEIEAPPGESPVVYLHLAAHADAEIRDDGVAILVNGRQVATVVYPQLEFSARLVRGRDEPSIQGWVSPSYGQRLPSYVIELVGTPGVRTCKTEIVLSEPRPQDELFQRPLPGGLQLPFLYACRTDRALPRSDSESERRLVVEYFRGTPDAIHTNIQGMFEEAEFAKQRERPEQGGVRAFYRHESGVRVNVLIRPDETYSVHAVGAVGTVYMAFVLPHELE